MCRKLQRPALMLLGALTFLWCARAAGSANPRFTGTPFMRTWTADDYGGGAGNRAVLQHPKNGFIYVGNSAGVLEFDGANWRLFPVPGGLLITALAVDKQGRVWFATDDEVGCLQPDERGELRATSAQGRLPRDEPAIFPLGACLATDDGVFFVNRDRVICFGADDAPARIWRFPAGNVVQQIWLMEGAVHVRRPNGVLRLTGGEFQLVPGLRTFAFVTRADPAGGWQMVSRDGLRRWNGAYQPVAAGKTGVVSPLAGDFALNAAFLGDGRIAFGTTRSGLVISDRSGERQQVIDRVRGLPSNRIEGLCVDREGGVWLALRNGVVRVELDSPYARHGTTQRRIDTTPQALALHANQLYVGGGEGLSRRDAAGNFHPVEDVPYLVRSLVPHDGRLFVTGIELRLVQPDDRTRLLDATYFGLVPLKATPNHFVHGHNDGVSIDRLEGEAWTTIGRHRDITGATTALAEWPAGIVWVANHTTGLWQIDFRGGSRVDAPAKNFGAADGLPNRINQYNIEVFPLGRDVGVIAAGRLLQFHEATRRFGPETRIEGLPRGEDGVVTAVRASPPERDGSFWLQLRDPALTIVRIVPAGPERWRAERPPGPPLPRLHTTALLSDPHAQSLWISGAGALISRDLTWKRSDRRDAIVPTIRRLEQSDGRLLWSDGHRFTSARGAATESRFEFPASHNALRVTFAAPTFGSDHLGRAHLRFRTRLAGLERDWTPWTKEAQRDFTNLPYRAFTFQVQVQDDEGGISAPATLAFSIAPPWWRTGAAVIGCVVLALAGVFGLVRWRTRALRHRNAQLETAVAVRTEQLQRSNAELARLHGIERDEKLAARLGEEKARLEVLRYQLNPHFLFNALNSVCAQIIREPGAARAMVVRIAEFCRQTLHRPEPDQSAMTIGQELKMLRSYLDIEKSRLGELLTVEIETDAAAEQLRIPPFLLLPLVENAIKYGTATSAERVGVRLAVRCLEHDTVEIEVANTGEWLVPGAHSTPSTGIGLENLRQRLARYYPEAHNLTTHAAGGWVTVQVRLYQPMRAGALA